jgi:hypothetical protein
MVWQLSMLVLFISYMIVDEDSHMMKDDGLGHQIAGNLDGVVYEIGEHNFSL